MPKKGLSAEEKEKAFQTWKESEEYQQIQKFISCRQKDELVNAVDTAYMDIWTDWQPILNELFATCEKLKVPGRKAKCKFHILTL